MDWDQYFISEAYLAACKSKDPSTQVGAVIVGPDREIRAKGFNGPPRGFNDDDDVVWQRPQKYSYIVCAEANCLYACALVGTSSKGCHMYCTFHPCSKCAAAIVQAGIVELITHVEFPGASQETNWAADRIISDRILSECRVTVRQWSGVPLIREIRANGILHRF